jgi:Domain of unknown function (DUF4386)
MEGAGKSARAGRSLMKGNAEVSVLLKARITGALYFLSLLMGEFGDYIFHDKAYTAGLLEIAGMTIVTILLYTIVKPVNNSLALLGMSLNLVAMIFEAQRVNPQGQSAGLVVHGIYIIIFAYLIFKSTFLPRTLGVLMAIAGLGWVTYLSTPFPKINLIFCLLGEVSLMLWLLVMGVNERRWKEQDSAAGASTRK